MADWRQIQARIRKARASGNPAENLAELHQRTRDAMVAFELARLHEKNGDNAEAARWYTTAAQQFRRAQWRVKAEEALSRLGAEIPERTIGTDLTAAIEESGAAGPAAARSEAIDTDREEREETEEEETVEIEPEQVAEAGPNRDASDAAEAPGTGAGRRRRRRGRRGGRKHRRGSAPAQEVGRGGPAPSVSRNVTTPSRSSVAASPAASASRSGAYRSEPVAEVRSAEPEAEPAEEPRFRPEPAAAATGRGRGVEPALSSRMAQLESRLRRLLACQLSSLSEAEQAPAGPGVLLLSDSDQVTHYYVEACQTLRIGIGNLLRGGRGSKEGGRIKQAMAENLGISESGVSKYLKDHCVVRWLQLDEGAPELAHFAIAVLHPIVNE